MTHQHTNSLAREKSPYLLQHAHNPVDWFAWNETAFAKARAEDKPVFLSIGYSTCHWCHVMERESFKDEAVGKFLNEHFVSIKVDREERPDVDKIYMTFVQSTTGSGGWPMNVFLTPDLKPFFGGTYFPPDARYGHPSFLQLLQQIAQLWCERRMEITASADELHARLELITARDARENSPLTPNALRHALEQFKDAYDPTNGGFGGAPKFPQPSIPSLVLRAAKRFDDDTATKMVLHTCDAMARGGIHDQLGGGFARYAVDAQWLVPHFEKMLYDNAQLAQLYLDAHLVLQSFPLTPALSQRERENRSQSSDEMKAASGSANSQSPETSRLLSPLPAGEGQDEGEISKTRLADTARDILDYVLRDMTHPGGGFYSAEDADSEGQEGKFYCWTHDELSKLLSPEEFIVATKHFGITKEGNFVDHSHPTPLPGQNVLSIVDPETPEADKPLLASAKAKMLATRAKRIRPHLDDKILASWNGLMLGAFARAGVVLDEQKYLVAAEKNLWFVREKLWDAKTKTLFHRWRDGARDDVQLLEGYAFYLSGVIELYEATLNPAHLDFAIQLAEALLAKFFDPANGGFWQSPAGTTDLILRIKDDYDGAEPSGNSVATLALLKLGKITGNEAFTHAAELTLQLFAARLQKQPAGLAFMLHALDFWLDEPRRIVIAGDPNSQKFHALLRAAHSVYQPDKVVLGNTGAVEPFAKTLATNDAAAVFVCLENACQLPTKDIESLTQLLR